MLESVLYHVNVSIRTLCLKLSTPTQNSSFDRYRCLNQRESVKDTLNSGSLTFLLQQHFLFSSYPPVISKFLINFSLIYPPCIFIFEGGKVLSSHFSMIWLIWFGWSKIVLIWLKKNLISVQSSSEISYYQKALQLNQMI